MVGGEEPNSGDGSGCDRPDLVRSKTGAQGALCKRSDPSEGECKISGKSRSAKRAVNRPIKTQLQIQLELRVALLLSLFFFFLSPLET
jgi:hypothetical protein